MIQKSDLVLISSNGFPLDIVTCIDIQAEGNKKDFWDVTFVRNIGSFSVPFSWKLDNEQLNGEPFTINNIPYELSIFLRTLFKEKEIKTQKITREFPEFKQEDNSMF